MMFVFCREAICLENGRYPSWVDKRNAVGEFAIVCCFRERWLCPMCHTKV